jgi:hypothetical protein
LDASRINTTISTLGAYSFAAAQRAYGAPASARTNQVAPAPGANASAPIAKIGDAIQRPSDSVAVQPRTASGTISDRLVAAVVPGRIDFAQDSPVQTRPIPSTANSLPFYRHPADKNSAATRIAISTAIDLNA